MLLLRGDLIDGSRLAAGPDFDRTPPEFITALTTENGLYRAGNKIRMSQ